MRDLHNSIDVRRVLSPLATAIVDNTAQVGQIVDHQGYDSAEYIIATGNLADLDATFAVTMDEGNAANLSDATAVAAADLVGTYTAAGFIFSDDDKVKKLGYIGSKRYTRLTITPALNTGAAPLAAVCVLSNPVNRSTPTL